MVFPGVYILHLLKGTYMTFPRPTSLLKYKIYWYVFYYQYLLLYKSMIYLH